MFFPSQLPSLRLRPLRKQFEAVSQLLQEQGGTMETGSGRKGASPGCVEGAGPLDGRDPCQTFDNPQIAPGPQSRWPCGVPGVWRSVWTPFTRDSRTPELPTRVAQRSRQQAVSTSPGPTCPAPAPTCPSPAELGNPGSCSKSSYGGRRTGPRCSARQAGQGLRHKVDFRALSCGLRSCWPPRSRPLQPFPHAQRSTINRNITAWRGFSDTRLPKPGSRPRRRAQRGVGFSVPF